MDTIIFANHKGGVGKTALATHLGWYAMDQGKKVLVVDTDQQADAFAHFSGSDEPEHGTAHSWGEKCAVVWWPDATVAPTIKGYDLVLWDMPPKVFVAPTVPSTGIVVPVDGPFAMKNAADFIASATVPCILVANGLHEGGKVFETALKNSFKVLPPHVTVCPVELLRGGSIRRSADNGAPAWQDVYSGQAGARIRQWAAWILAEGIPWCRSKRAA